MNRIMPLADIAEVSGVTVAYVSMELKKHGYTTNRKWRSGDALRERQHRES